MENVRHELEEAVRNYMDEAIPDFTNGDFDRYAVGQAFEDGAYWMLEKIERIIRYHTERRYEQ